MSFLAHRRKARILAVGLGAVVLLSGLQRLADPQSKWRRSLTGVISASAASQKTIIAESSQSPAAGDQYGGTSVHVQKRTGYFTVAKVGKRWVFVTPDGNAFWMRSVYHALEGLNAGVMESKYGGNVNLWATQRNRRLLSWGFNTLGEYTYVRGIPVGSYGSPVGNPVKLPFILLLNALQDGNNVPSRIGLKDPLKNIFMGVPTSAWNGWRGRLADVYDPHLADAYRGEIVNANKAYTGGFAHIPWIVGITPDDADYLYILKGSGDGKIIKYPHPAYLVAVANFSYTSAEDAQHREFKDNRLYSKYAWIDFLKKKYTNIGALNAAWHSDYSSFDDDGGYGSGKGVLDEDGRHRAWMGSDALMLKDAQPAVRADLNAFLYEFARHYAETGVKTIREADRNHLIFGPSSINSWGMRARDEVLRGFADGGVDVFCFSILPLEPNMVPNNEAYDITGKPAFFWYTVSANQDSDWHDAKPIFGAPDVPTQEARAAAYARDIMTFYDAKGKNGDSYAIGIAWWQLADSGKGEHGNWGLITHKDNAYDGKEAVRAQGKDPWGFTTGGEDQDYGDFLSTVRKSNFGIQDLLTRDLAPYAQNAGAKKSRE